MHEQDCPVLEPFLCSLWLLLLFVLFKRVYWFICFHVASVVF